MFTVFKNFLWFRIFKQLAFALKTVCPEILHCIEYTFHNQDFWATCACPKKQSLPLFFLQAGGGCRPPPRTPMARLIVPCLLFSALCLTCRINFRRDFYCANGLDSYQATLWNSDQFTGDDTWRVLSFDTTHYNLSASDLFVNLLFFSEVHALKLRLMFIHMHHMYVISGKQTIYLCDLRFLRDRVWRRAITRLDGARGKKQVWRPHVRNWGLSETNVLHWRMCLWHCWDFSAPGVIRRPPRWFGAPIVIRRPGSCASSYTNRTSRYDFGQLTVLKNIIPCSLQKVSRLSMKTRNSEYSFAFTAVIDVGGWALNALLTS